MNLNFSLENWNYIVSCNREEAQCPIFSIDVVKKLKTGYHIFWNRWTTDHKRDQHCIGLLFFIGNKYDTPYSVTNNRPMLMLFRGGKLGGSAKCNTRLKHNATQGRLMYYVHAARIPSVAASTAAKATKSASVMLEPCFICKSFICR